MYRKASLTLLAVTAALLITSPAHAVTWTAVNSGTSDEITSIDYQSDSRFWFVTGGGDIYKRQGDGSFKRTFDGPVGLSHIAFQPSGDVGIAISPTAEIYRSANGGDSWAPVTGLQGTNSACTGEEAVTTTFTVRWAGNDAVYLFAGGNKVVRSAGANVGATGTWTNANPMLSSGTCRAEFQTTGSGPGVTDGVFTPGSPNRGWMIGANFGEIFFAQDVTQNNSYQKKPAAATNGFQTAKRLVADPGNVNRQWAVALDEGGNGSYIGRSNDGWGTEADWAFAGTRPDRTSNHDIAVGGGTVINVGQSGMIEMSPDGQTFYYTPAGGELATRDWRSVDVADASHAAVGGVGGTLVLASDANTPPDLVKPTGTIVVPPVVNASVPAAFTLQANEAINPASVSWRSFTSGVPAQVGQTVSYTFPRDGIYTLEATFSDLAGNVGEAEARVTVTKPQVDFTPAGGKSPIPTPGSQTIKGKKYTVLNVRGTLGVPPGIAKSHRLQGDDHGDGDQQQATGDGAEDEGQQQDVQVPEEDPLPALQGPRSQDHRDARVAGQHGDVA